jgi:putative flippase GtrA
LENQKTRLMGEFLKFGITGGLGTITNLTIFFISVDLFGFSPVLMSIVCFVIAGTQNYFINQNWAFRGDAVCIRFSFIKWLKFLSGSLIGLLINILVMKFILAHFELLFKFIAQGCGIASGMMINFIISKYFIFRRKKDPQEH